LERERRRGGERGEGRTEMEEVVMTDDEEKLGVLCGCWAFNLWMDGGC